MSDLISEPPGGPDALLDVLDEAVTGLQSGVVIQRGPDLATHLLQQKQHVKREYFRALICGLANILSHS